MKVTHKLTNIRASTEIDYFAIPPDVKKYRNDYFRRGLIVETSMTSSDDNLTKTVFTVWKDQESLMDFRSLSLIKETRLYRKLYNQEMGIEEISEYFDEAGNKINENIVQSSD
jgi:hypothetical protein